VSVNKEKIKIECKENTGSEISLDIVLNYLITSIKQEKIEKIAEKLNCKAHKKQFAYYCQNCKLNLCEDCNKPHKCSKDSKDIKIVSFNELNKESEIKEAYIKEYFNKFMNKSIKNQENHTVLKKEIILYLPKIYNAVTFSKENFPNYAHFFNIDKIYLHLLDNRIEIKYLTKNEQKIRVFGKKFVENNRNKITLIIDGKELELCEYYEIKNKELEELTIILVQKGPIESMKDMFKNCSCLTSVTKKLWIQKKIIDMSYMFCGCNKLNKVDLFSETDVSEVTDFSYMFNECNSIKEIELSNFNTGKAKKLNNMFYECELLEKIEGISEFITDNVEDMSSMFYECKKLKEIDLSRWNFSKVRNVSNFFKKCESLETIKLNENKNANLTNMESMFSKCKNLKNLFGLDKWNTKNVRKMKKMFYECSHLENFSDISKWDISNVEDNFNKMFTKCSKKIKIPPWKG
jgi:surface protein